MEKSKLKIFNSINLSSIPDRDLIFTCYKNRRHYLLDLGEKIVRRDDGEIRKIISVNKTNIIFEPFEEVY